MKMVIAEETLLKQLQQIEMAIDQKLLEIRDLENVLNATKALLNTYKETPNSTIPNHFHNPNIQTISAPGITTISSASIASKGIPTIPSSSYPNGAEMKFFTSDKPYNVFIGSKLGGGTSIDALKVILEKGPLPISEITDRLLEMGHFRDNVHPKSSVHVTLTRRKDLFTKIQDKNEIRWKLKK